VSDAPLNKRDFERVIARAMEIDAHGREHTRKALHKVAAQLNISPAAMDQAIAEVAAGNVTLEADWDAPAVDHTTTGARRWLTAASVAIGIVSGLLAGSTYTPAGGDRDTLLLIVLLFAVSAGLLWAHHEVRKPWSLMARLTVLWSSFAYAWMVGYGQLVDWALETTLLAGAASLMVGTAAHVGWRAWLRVRRPSRRARTHAARAIQVFTPAPRPFNTPV